MGILCLIHMCLYLLLIFEVDALNIKLLLMLQHLYGSRMINMFILNLVFALFMAERYSGTLTVSYRVCRNVVILVFHNFDLKKKFLVPCVYAQLLCRYTCTLNTIYVCTINSHTYISDTLSAQLTLLYVEFSISYTYMRDSIEVKPILAIVNERREYIWLRFFIS